MNITIIGCGHMGITFARAFIASGLVDTARLFLVEKDNDRIAQLKAQNLGMIIQPSDPVIRQSDITLLAVKPQDFTTIVQDLKKVLRPHTVLLSIMAGITIQRIQEAFDHCSVIRAMPNAAVVNGHGMTAYYCSACITNKQIILVESLFNAMGISIPSATEEMLNAVTALSGSGPAYFFYFMEAMVKAGIKMEVPEDMAYTLLKQTMLGAYYMIETSGWSLQELIATIASKGGTTQAALDLLDDHSVALHLQQALLAAEKRAKELSGIA